ncbi:hypothetical protein [Planobispora longispora]|uniref:Secreted protein n=1 Tax=Planobispora longispora TaxID=28887 RepID=A0A8J3RF60_9ACTN|nr:hypothetical protein [Planobispora longispora]BFE77896.1 hypothetical protein GCM10020093_004970 [Planobispora longispora]GIH73709.1 hypothetical protein Plo01_01380 [Planobispora longispora]
MASRTLSTAVSLTVAAVSLVALSTGSANAASCGESTSINVSSSLLKSQSVWTDTDHGWRQVTVELRQAGIFGGSVKDRSYAQMKGHRSGDLTWVDRSGDGGSTWAQCGLGNRAKSPAYKHRYMTMRACMAVWKSGVSKTYCTYWHYDAD